MSAPSSPPPTTPHDHQVQDSETVFEGRIISVRKDQVTMPGDTTSQRDVVVHPGAVGAVALDEQGRVLLVNQYRHPVRRRLDELPAGLLDKPGESALAAAQRELVEEAGIEADEWSTLVDIVGCPGFADESVRVFLARGLRSVDRPAGGDDEEADLVIRRVPLDDLVTGAMAGALVNGPCVAGVFAAAAVRDGYAPRPVDAPWDHKPSQFAARRAAQG